MMPTEISLQGKTVAVGVSGGIAAYKAVEVVSRLRKLGADVRVVMTRNAQELVDPATFHAISGNRVACEMFSDAAVGAIGHIELAESVDLMVICPATANVVGKIACGIADDFLTTTAVACQAPILLCPAMNHKMYANPVVQGNLSRLRSLGYNILEPEYGRLASGALGKGRLPEPSAIVAEVERMLGLKSSFCGVTFLITAGPTREHLDPVRFISSPSTGKMGYALAEAASHMGARVILVSGPSNLPVPAGVEVSRVVSTRDMLEACKRHYDESHVVIGAAAPSDFTPHTVSAEKIKKTGRDETVRLVPTPDVLKTLSEDKGDRVIVGFAAETSDIVNYALDKIRVKNLDFVCANHVGMPDRGFEADTNAVTIVYPDGTHEDLPFGTKKVIAFAILERVQAALGSRGKPS